MEFPECFSSNVAECINHGTRGGGGASHFEMVGGVYGVIGVVLGGAKGGGKVKTEIHTPPLPLNRKLQRIYNEK